MQKLRVGINGFGRIGRLIFRLAFDRLNIVGVNNLSPIDVGAHLLKYDSVHGVYEKDIKIKKGSLFVDNEEVFFSSYEDPSNIPWDQWEVDLILECTGSFKKREDLEKHFRIEHKTHKKVLVSAPVSNPDITIVFGVNHEKFDTQKHKVLSNASCTTNCLAPIILVLQKHFGIKEGFMTTVHSYTNDQRLLDASHKDLRRSRAAALSMIPTSTGATNAVLKIFPELKGRLKGLALRVPTPNVSLLDFVFNSEKKLSQEQIEEAFTEAGKNELKGIIKNETLPLVSSDFNGSPYSAIIDVRSSSVIRKNMGKIIAWYDNEMGFSHRMVDLALYIASQRKNN